MNIASVNLHCISPVFSSEKIFEVYKEADTVFRTGRNITVSTKVSYLPTGRCDGYITVIFCDDRATGRSVVNYIEEVTVGTFSGILRDDTN